MVLFFSSTSLDDPDIARTARTNSLAISIRPSTSPSVVCGDLSREIHVSCVIAREFWYVRLLCSLHLAARSPSRLCFLLSLFLSVPLPLSNLTAPVKTELVVVSVIASPFYLYRLARFSYDLTYIPFSSSRIYLFCVKSARRVRLK